MPMRRCPWMEGMSQGGRDAGATMSKDRRTMHVTQRIDNDKFTG